MPRFSAQVQGRWGDYSDLTVDPIDDCTFWYTQEYLEGGAAGAAYRFVDRKAKSRTLHTYRLQVVDLKGKRSWYGVGSAPARS